MLLLLIRASYSVVFTLQAVYGKYYWQSFAEVNERVINTCSGLLVLAAELQRSTPCRVCIFAETRAEWIISVFACFKANLPGLSCVLLSGNRIVSNITGFLRASAMLKHVIDIGWTSVCLSVRHTLVLYQNG